MWLSAGSRGPVRVREVGMWALSTAAGRTPCSDVPAPLAVVRVELADGSEPAFVFEGHAAADGDHVTEQGGSRAYLAAVGP